MGYKTILTAVAADDVEDDSLGPVTEFADAHGAHLEALCYGIDHAYPAYHYGGISHDVLQASQEKARHEAVEVRKAVSAAIDASGVEGTARAVIAGISGIGDVLADRGRLADLAMLMQASEEESPRLHDMIVEAALFAAHLPVLLIPRGVSVTPWPKRIIVGWDDGAQALAAVRAALPLLKQAETVSIVIVDPPRHASEHADPGHDVSLMLSRHGVPADIVVLARTLPSVSEMLMRQATDTRADLLVMGAYGHSRFRETVFGGTTRRMLTESTVPLLLAR